MEGDSCELANCVCGILFSGAYQPQVELSRRFWIHGDRCVFRFCEVVIVRQLKKIVALDPLRTESGG